MRMTCLYIHLVLRNSVLAVGVTAMWHLWDMDWDIHWEMVIQLVIVLTVCLS